MRFSDLASDDGLRVLNTLLASRSYIVSFSPSQADVAVFKDITSHPDLSQYPHVARWYKHIDTYKSEFATLPGDPFKPYTTYGPEVDEASVTRDADDDDEDLYGREDEEEDQEAVCLQKERLAAYKAKKAIKPKPAAKSVVTLDVKPWDDETDMAALEALVRSIEKDGLVWGASKLVAVGFGIKKLQINLVVEDEKVSTVDLQEEIESFEDYVQSSDVVAMQKL
ncbi:elongation factor -1 beta,delta, putative [Talaromyces stipitatus ATCC 10500]|uniref:Elongation factor-1 beta,delta, putative n=1 Tax=Talaromyces stipitatus (strain ATCC 10500 / CBS 375.48 / QM 6759 / NRRL 1006) TaxID=441959 RepID=B8MNC9_TALSN|nr:elongation factor -1 beta,delta, putative [Talaromyces stipitatus ATCC 10500]EED14018.1 elongation factor -1 beta,delta, putative [Talaromyces stipitatus ATCC 10500]